MKRFTVDGDAGLEDRLAVLCRRIGSFLAERIPASEFHALVLGGGYGRGEGGVLASSEGDQPYNDMEFYLFLSGHPVWQERRHRRTLAAAIERFQEQAGLHLEFKIDSLRGFRRRPISMFSYDLVAGHRVVVGPETLFADCGAHARPDSLPLSEATRLLFNRCSGLLLAKQRLEQDILSDEDRDFVERNLAKARLAFGDALLTACGCYHWSCRERHRRLGGLPADLEAPHLQRIREIHGQGVAFKLRPTLSRSSVDELRAQHRELSALGRDLWLWCEARRLHQPFATPSAYALSRVPKCPEQSAWQSRLAHCRRQGLSGLCRSESARYPRERLFHALSLLLWEPHALREPKQKLRLQHQLATSEDTFAGFVSAYEGWWAHYG